MKCPKCDYISEEDKKQTQTRTQPQTSTQTQTQTIKSLLSAIATQDKPKAEALTKELKPLWWR